MADSGSRRRLWPGTPSRKGGELRKVLGLRWDTQEDKICVDIKLNYGE